MLPEYGARTRLGSPNDILRGNEECLTMKQGSREGPLLFITFQLLLEDASLSLEGWKFNHI